jgi:DNA-binding transcriptional regulator of glucitol operon
MIVIVTGFLILGWWQFRRAAGGNALSWGYTFEWPLFAGFVVVFWLRTMRDEWRETHPAGGEQAPTASGVTLPAGVRAPVGAEDGSDGEEEDAELAAYNAYLARLNAETARTGGWITQRGSRRQAGWSGAGGASAGTGAADGAAHSVSQHGADSPRDMEV